MSFGDRLQTLRRSRGLTQEQFAQQLKVSRQAVSKWESGRGYPEIEKIIYICNCYGVSMGELFRDEAPAAAPEEEAPPPGPLPSPSLKKSVGNFLTNLSPANLAQLWLGAALLSIVVVALLCALILKGGDEMIAEIIWTVLLVLFALVEAVTVGLTSIWFATGSLVALVCALLGGGWPLQIVLFLAASALSLLAFRPLAKKYLNDRVQPTNADRVIGTEAWVSEDIDNLNGKGAVTLNGIRWTARSEDDSRIAAGTLVKVLRIEGVKVFVEPINTPVAAGRPEIK